MDKDFKKISSVIGEWFKKHPFVKDSGKVKISEPIFASEEITASLRVLLLSDGWIAQGPKVKEFEDKFAKYIGVKEAVATNSGSSANFLALSALMEEGMISAGDEVIIPAATFPTVATPVVQHSLKPVFVDVEMDANISPREIKRAISPKTKMIIAVHTLGKPADIAEIKKIAKENNLVLFEDACEAHGASINGKKVGSFGHVGTFSFYVAHNMTTAEGGMIVTNDKKLAQIARSLRDFGRFMTDGKEKRFSVKDPILGKYDTRQLFSRLGYNLRMTDIQAAMGIEQLKKLDNMNKKRLENAKFYLKNFSKFEKFFYLPKIGKGRTHVFYGFLLIIKHQAPFNRGGLVSFLEKEGIETRPLFGGCLPDQPAFRRVKKRIVGDLANSRLIRDSAFFIGCHPGISLADRQKVVKTFTSFLKPHFLR